MIIITIKEFCDCILLDMFRFSCTEYNYNILWP